MRMLSKVAALALLREEAKTALDRRNTRTSGGAPYVFQGCPPSCLRFIVQVCNEGLEAGEPS